MIWGLGDENRSSDLNSNEENAGYVLVQGNGRHPNDLLVIIALEALMDVNFLTGRPSWYPGLVGQDDCHVGDV